MIINDKRIIEVSCDYENCNSHIIYDSNKTNYSDFYYFLEKNNWVIDYRWMGNLFHCPIHKHMSFSHDLDPNLKFLKKCFGEDYVFKG